MKNQIFKSDALLLTTAVIWGFAFVAQRVGMAYTGPFTFNGMRFALGGLTLMPLLVWQAGKMKRADLPQMPTGKKTLFLGGGAAGLALFAGASLQQVGLVETTAGKAGFITGLYVVIVPILGLFWKQQPGIGTWVGAGLAAVGLYLLSVTGQMTIARGDLLVLLGSFFWAGHVLIIGWLSPRVNPFFLAFIQYAACSALSMTVAVAVETITLSGLYQAAAPLFYGGCLSVGVAYTLQVVAQKQGHPAHAAILLSLEAVFAAIGGWLLLGETLSVRGMTGCCLMLTGMLLSQLQSYIFRPALSFSLGARNRSSGRGHPPQRPS